MKHLIEKIEARIADRRDELECWVGSDRAIQLLEAEIAFLESVLTDLAGNTNMSQVYRVYRKLPGSITTLATGREIRLDFLFFCGILPL